MSEAERKKKKRKKGVLEAQIMSIVRTSLKATIDEAMKDIMKGFK